MMFDNLKSRRDVLQGSAALFAGAVLPSLVSRANDGRSDDLLISAIRRADGRFALLLFTLSGRIEREIPLKDRGHDVAYHANSGRVVSFARRPGRFALAFHARDKNPPMLFVPPKDRHFYGHGAFSRDGRLLYATENDFENGLGVIGVYDVGNSYRRIGEFPSHGVGPHELLLMFDGRTLVVANGGIETHPEYGREKLNLPTMEPSLCFIDIKTGDLKLRHVLGRQHRKLSIRHLATNKQGLVWFGGQWQGGLETSPSLIGSASVDQSLRLLASMEPYGPKFKGYIGSVALSGDGRWLAASAPRAGRIIYVDTQDGSQHHLSDLEDGCGIAPLAGKAFAVSSGLGVLRQQSPTGDKIGSTRLPGTAFDNHMRNIS